MTDMNEKIAEIWAALPPSGTDVSDFTDEHWAAFSALGDLLAARDPYYISPEDVEQMNKDLHAAHERASRYQVVSTSSSGEETVLGTLELSDGAARNIRKAFE